MDVRMPDFAGSWYPASESECRGEIESYIKKSVPLSAPDIKKVGGIVPHAGWFFSGQIACNVIKCLKDNQIPDVVVLFGMHLSPGSRNFIMREGYWETPLGNLEIHQELAERLIEEFPFTVESASRHSADNTIELQLPFIKYFFPEIKIVPIGIPPVRDSLKIGERVVEISQELGIKMIVIGSTDLTHYGYNYGFIPKGLGEEALDWVRNENDKRVIERMVAMDAEGVISEGLKRHNACCSGAAATAIAAGRTLGAVKAEKIIYATSYDKSPGNSFVGYAGIVF
jgi:AmmeMemoRadiSam system protein B